MNQITIVHAGELCAQWEEWLQALEDVGMEIDVVDPLDIRFETYDAPPGGTILLDGMVASVSDLIQRVCMRWPDTQIIVATAVDSFSIYYEIMYLDGAIYLSGPISTDEFVEKVECIVNAEMTFA